MSESDEIGKVLELGFPASKEMRPGVDSKCNRLRTREEFRSYAFEMDNLGSSSYILGLGFLPFASLEKKDE